MKQSMVTRVSKRYRPWVLLLLASALYLPMLGTRDIVTSHEARVVQSAREMADAGWPWAARPMQVPAATLGRLPNGALRLLPAPGEPPVAVNPWLVPTLNGVIRLQKPPLPYWCAAILFKTFGGWSELLARLVPAIFAAIATLLVYDLARSLIGDLGAWFAGLVWLSSYFVFDPYRKAMPDPYLAFFTLMGVWAWVRGSSPDRRRARGMLVLAFYAALALGALAKGPVIFLHVALALIAYHACYRRRPPGRWWAHAAGVVLFVATTAPWPIYVLSHVPHALDVWRYESVGELGENVENAQRWWYYFPQLFLISLPWTPAWMVGLGAPWGRRGLRRRRLLFPVVWFAATVVFFSLVNLKKNAYLLPVMPAQTLFIAQGLRTLLAACRRHRKDRFAEAMIGAQLALAGGVAVALPIVAFKSPVGGAGVRVAGVLLGAVALGVTVYATRAVGRRGLWLTAVPPALAIAFALMLFGLLNLMVPPRDNLRSPRAVAAAVTAKLAEPGTVIHRQHLAPEVAVYLPFGTADDSGASRVLVVHSDRVRGAAPLTPADLQVWFEGRRIVAADPVPVAGPVGPRRWGIVELRMEK